MKKITAIRIITFFCFILLFQGTQAFAFHSRPEFPTGTDSFIQWYSKESPSKERVVFFDSYSHYNTYYPTGYWFGVIGEWRIWPRGPYNGRSFYFNGTNWTYDANFSGQKYIRTKLGMNTNSWANNILTNVTFFGGDGSTLLNANYIPHYLTITIDPSEGAGDVTVDDVSCSSCPCQYLVNIVNPVELEAFPNSGYEFDHWEWNSGANSSTLNPLALTMTEDEDVTAVFKEIIAPQSSVKNQYFPDSQIRLYAFTLSEATSIAILSGGTLDIKAIIKNSSGNAVADENGNYSFSGYTDIGSVSETSGHAQTNFMFRKQNLAAGTYTLEVTPETAETSTSGTFSIVFLKRPANSDEFFTGMDALVDETLGDGDASNDYLDIYVKALYPELYETVDSLEPIAVYAYGCIDYQNVEAERQCKALVQFYLHQILGNSYLEGDTYIQSTNWMTFDDEDENCVSDRDYIMVNDADGVLIYHSNASFGTPNCDSGKYFYDPDTQTVYRGDADLGDYFYQGDVFVDNSVGHYGLIYYYDETAEAVRVLDANWSYNGKIHSATRSSNNWKVTRPQ